MIGIIVNSVAQCMLDTKFLLIALNTSGKALELDGGVPH